jgi:hypothetical protein
MNVFAVHETSSFYQELRSTPKATMFGGITLDAIVVHAILLVFSPTGSVRLGMRQSF